MNAREIMTENPVYCLPDTNLQAVARLMVEHVCGGIPVVESPEALRPIGMLTDRDITCRAVAGGRNPLELSAHTVMTEPAITVKPDTGMDECRRVMEQEEVRRLIVVDENGRLVGIIAPADLTRVASEHEIAEVMQELSRPVDVPSRPAAKMPRGHH